MFYAVTYVSPNYLLTLTHVHACGYVDASSQAAFKLFRDCQRSGMPVEIHEFMHKDGNYNIDVIKVLLEANNMRIETFGNKLSRAVDVELYR